MHFHRALRTQVYEHTLMPTSPGPRPAALKKVTSAASSSASASMPVTPMISRFHCLRITVGMRQQSSSSQQAAEVSTTGRHCNHEQHRAALTSAHAVCLWSPVHTASTAQSAA